MGAEGRMEANGGIDLLDSVAGLWKWLGKPPE